jgi:hypothetical protein
MRKGSTKKPEAVPFNRVHRPTLTVGAQILAAKHQPPRCPCTTDQRFGWLMEKPVEGQASQYYCSNCGVYRFVHR